MGRLLGWSVTFLRLPGVSGEIFFTPLFDIVKHTTTEGLSALFTGSGSVRVDKNNFETSRSAPK
jgi:hypothetical protein